MRRRIIQTADGSSSLLMEEWGETYHSKHGAIQEAQHVFIQNGLSLSKGESVAILEIGFGTGLNAFISLLESEKRKISIDYVGIEAYPVVAEEVAKLNYVATLHAEAFAPQFEMLHQSSWETTQVITSFFTCTKRKLFFQDINYHNCFDLIYFDAFGYQYQPDLWSEAIFKLMFNSLKRGGILVTYACRSSIIKAMKQAGFSVEKLKGPPGKREMLRASKI